MELGLQYSRGSKVWSLLLDGHRGKNKNKNKKQLVSTVPVFGSCVKVEVAVLGSPSLIILTVSVDVKQH